MNVYRLLEMEQELKKRDIGFNRLLNDWVAAGTSPKADHIEAEVKREEKKLKELQVKYNIELNNAYKKIVCR